MSDTRPPDHDLSFERALLGAVLLEPSRFAEASAIVAEADFFRLSHRYVWAAYRRLDAAATPIDYLSVHASLQAAGHLDEVTVVYLSGLVDGVPKATNVAAYATRVKDKALERNFRAVLDAASKAVAHHGVTAETVADVSTRLARLLPFAGAGSDDRFERVADGHYRLAGPDALGTDLEVRHVRRERYQLYGELTVRTRLAGVRTVHGVLLVASVNLSNVRDRDSLARALADRTTSTAALPEWRRLVDDLGVYVSLAETEGSPSVRLTGQRTEARATAFHRALGFSLPAHLPAMVFGDGDCLKTMTIDAVAVALARQGLRVGIVDAEMTEDDHKDRVARLAGGQAPGVLEYLEASRPLIHEIDRVAEMVRAHRLQYLLFDSVGFLAHDRPESPDAALAYFRAVRTLGVGSFHVAHRAKAEEGDQRPFGSAFWFNSVRALWFAKRSEAGAASSVAEVGLFPRKFNVGAWPAAHALRFTFHERETDVENVEPTAVASLATAMPIKDRVKQLLRTGPKDLDAIAAALPDTDEATLDRTLRRYTGDKAKVRLFNKLADGRIGLAERRLA